MNRICILLSAVFVNSFAAFAQTCTAPISDMEFQQKLGQLTALRSDPPRLQEAKAFSSTRCLLSTHVKQIAGIFASDASRLEFAKSAWNNTYDKMNFFDVYDAFSTYSAVFRLDNWVTEAKASNSNSNGNRNASNTALPKYPNIPYPNCNNYRGRTGCGLPIADADFEIMAKPLFAKTTDADRQASGKQLLQSNCLSMAQLMKLGSLIEMESMRLGFMKENFLLAYDLENYNYAAELFSHVPYKNDWLNYAAAQIAVLNNNNNANSTVTDVCEVKPEEFQQLKKSVEKEYSAFTKMNVAKQVIAAKKCFATAQLKEIVGGLNSEMDRLSLAKYAYDYCTDKSNYYLMNDVFLSSNSKNELAKYISTKK